MRRHEYAREEQQQAAAAAAYQQELLRRNLLRSQNVANIKRLRHEAAPKAIPTPMPTTTDHFYERRFSFESQPDMPVYSKFIYPQYHNGGVGGGLLNDSLSSLLPETELVSYGRQQPAYYYNEPLADEPASTGINTEQVVRNLTAFGRLLEMIQGWPLPRLSFNTACICYLIVIFIAPRPCVQSLLFPAFRLFFGTLYPAYASYKAVRTKDVKEYVKWMMYWIVFAFFTCIETFTDIFLSWFPFYYEVKVIIVLWLLSPATKGSSTLYRKFVHPMLTRREQEIDEYLNQAKERGYSAVLQLGSKGVNYATNVIMQTAIKGGGNLVQTIKRSYSLSDLSEPDVQRTKDEIDEVMALRPQQRLLRARNQTALGRSSSGSRHSTGMYFTEVDVTAKGAGDFNYNIRSTDDISSGYSSAEPLSVGLSRTSSMTNASKARLKTKRNENVVAYEQFPRESVPSVPQQFQHFYLVDDLRDEVFLENELYFQNAHDSTLDDDLSAAESTDLLVQQPVEMAEKQVMAPKVERTSSEQQVTLPSPNTMSIEDQMTLPSPNTTSIEQQMKPPNVEPPKIAHESDDDDDDDDFFEATLLVDSNDLSDAAPKRLDVDVIDKAPPVLNIEVKLDNTAANNKTPSFRPRELLSTLEEIQNNFRAQIETNNEIERPRAQHNKGKAPPPPSSLTPPSLPPRTTKPERDNLDTISLTSTMTRSERTPSPARTTGIGNLFKNIKANVLRSKANNNDGQDNRAQQQINQANVIQPGKIHVR